MYAGNTQKYLIVYFAIWDVSTRNLVLCNKIRLCILLVKIVNKIHSQIVKISAYVLGYIEILHELLIISNSYYKAKLLVHSNKHY